VGDNKNKLTLVFKEGRFYKNKWFIYLIVLIVIISVGVGAWLFVSKYESSMWQSNNSESSTSAREKVAQLDKQIETTPSKETVAKTQIELQQFAKDAINNEVKQIYLRKSINLYISGSDYKSALTVAKQSEEIESTAITASDLACIYMGLSDYKEAAQYYQIAADRSEKTSDPTVRGPYNNYLILKRQAEALIK
jgi:tetratricopeptide (TPR) repeat protein